MCEGTKKVHPIPKTRFTPHEGLYLMWFVSHFDTKYSDIVWQIRGFNQHICRITGKLTNFYSNTPQKCHRGVRLTIVRLIEVFL